MHQNPRLRQTKACVRQTLALNRGGARAKACQTSIDLAGKEEEENS